ncbi:MAG: 3-hydroxyacyl-CoA dehydrogenase family protein [Planctomycetota bacterium]
MTPNPIRRAAVLGAGTMGHGIAQVCAQGGCETVVHDVSLDLVERGLARIRENLAKAAEKGKLSPEDPARIAGRISGSTDLEGAVRDADVVIEAIPEDLELKRRTFERVSEACPPTALLATNTSSLPVSKIAAACANPERVLGLHFFNPPFVMKLLEVVRAEATSEEALERALALAATLGKSAIVVRDAPGFATSRLGLALGLEAMRMLEQGVASAKDIDTAMKLGYGHPMGPLELTDLVGLDVRLAIAEHLERELGPAFRPPEILRRLVREGRLGRKSGRGFHESPSSAKE